MQHHVLINAENDRVLLQLQQLVLAATCVNPALGRAIDVRLLNMQKAVLRESHRALADIQHLVARRQPIYSPLPRRAAAPSRLAGILETALAPADANHIWPAGAAADDAPAADARIINHISNSNFGNEFLCNA